jgi:hypothetical protein
MPLYELTLVSGVMVGLAVLRFGVPIAIMWSFGQIYRRLSHAA